jgi:hypothetical protein
MADKNLYACLKANYLKVVISLLFLAYLSNIVSAQDTIPYLKSNDINSGRFITFKRLKQNDLYNYKGLDPTIYLEYGIQEMLIQEIIYNQILIRVEYSLMKDSAAAFGIFSVSRQKCSKQGSITRFDCLNMQKAQFVLGKLYVNVSAQISHFEVGKSCETIGKAIARKCWYKGWDYPQFFDTPAFYPYLNNVILIKGETAFYNDFPDWAEKFKGLKYEIVMLPVDFTKGSCAVAQISFKNMMDMNQFISKNGLESTDSYGAYTNTKGKTRQFLMIAGPKVVYYMESWGKTTELENFRFSAEQRIRNYLKSTSQK